MTYDELAVAEAVAHLTGVPLIEVVGMVDQRPTAAAIRAAHFVKADGTTTFTLEVE